MKALQNFKHNLINCGAVLLLSLSAISVKAAPSAPELISPIGMDSNQPPAFAWTEVATATWYPLWVKDEAGNVTAEWLKAANVCITGTCTYPLEVNTQGITSWRVRGYDGIDLGAWSDRAKFWDFLPSRPVATTLLAPLGRGIPKQIAGRGDPGSASPQRLPGGS